MTLSRKLFLLAGCGLLVMVIALGLRPIGHHSADQPPPQLPLPVDVAYLGLCNVW